MFKYINFLLLAILLLIFSCDELKPVIEGCTIETACNYNADATENDGNCVFEDGCNQWCDGDEGEPQEFDCSSECGGDRVEDNCGTCDNDSSNDCVQDCANDWGGSKEEDVCGVCGGTGIPFGKCDCVGNVIDCAGVCDGDAVEDDCGTCGGSITDINDCNFDCEGVPGGSAIIDECDVCGGGGIPNGECDCAGNVKDCAGVCDGDAVEDDCGSCEGYDDCFGCNDWYMENFICDNSEATNKCCEENDNNNDNRCKINGTGNGCDFSLYCREQYEMECDKVGEYCDYGGVAVGDPCSTSAGESNQDGVGLCRKVCDVWNGPCYNITCNNSLLGEYCDYAGAEVGTPCSTSEGSFTKGEGLCVLDLSDDVNFPTGYITYYDTECEDGTDDCCTEPTCNEPATLSLVYTNETTIQVNYISSVPIYGVEFHIPGTIISSGSGGVAADNSWSVGTSGAGGDGVLAVEPFFLTPIPAGSDILTNLTVTINASTEDLCLTGVIIANDPVVGGEIGTCPEYWQLTCIPIP